jgi:type IX secretion system PorP/SprF family membrane protein
MKKIFIISCLLVASGTVSAQQLQTSSFYDMQGVFHNPATAGTQGSMAGVTYRTQWQSFSGAPKTATVFGSFDLPAQNIGLGGYIYNDKTGPTSRTGLQLAFAKHIPTGNGGRFSLGIEAKGQQYRLDRDKLSATLGSDPALGTAENKMIFDAGFGIAYTSKKFQAGVSVSQLVQSKLDFYTGNLDRSEEGRLYRHYYLHGSYRWDVDGSTRIIPNILAIYLPNAPAEIQGGIRVEHSEVFWWGLGYRSRQSFMLSAGVNVNKKFTLGYSFDLYNTPAGTFDKNGNSHEILLRYNLKK